MKNFDIHGLEVFQMNRASITFIKDGEFYHATRSVANKIFKCLREKQFDIPFYVDNPDCCYNTVWIMTPSRFALYESRNIIHNTLDINSASIIGGVMS